MTSPTRVLYIALDGCDQGLIRRFAAAGHMPVISSLLATAASVETAAPVGLFVSSLWPTIFTATTAERHGYHCWDEYVPGTYEYRHTTPDEIVGVPFWETLSEAGKRVAILDVPHTKVRRPINGVQLVEWGCHDRHFGTHSWPVGLVDELEGVTGPHPIGCTPATTWDQFAPCDYSYRESTVRTTREVDLLFADLHEGIVRKERASLHLLDKGGWDFFGTVFSEGHCTGHQLWHLDDAAHPRHDARADAAVPEPVRAAYSRLDQAVGRLVDRVGPEAVVYVHLSHGMGPHYDGTHLLGAVLRRLEQFALGERTLGRTSSIFRDATRRLPDALRRTAVEAAARRAGERLDPGDDGCAGEDVPVGPDRLWFAAPNNTVVGGVRLNRVGREPSGRIEASEYRAACEWLRAELRDLVNLRTGESAVIDVKITDDEYRRAGVDSLPDLLVEWNRSAPIEEVWSPACGTIARPEPSWRTGDHNDVGLLLARGEGIAAGARSVRIATVDIAPTISHSLGVDLGPIDGRPRLDLSPRPHNADGFQHASGPRLTAPRAPWVRSRWFDRATAGRVSQVVNGLVREFRGLAAAHHETREATVRAAQALVDGRAHAEALEARLQTLDADLAAIRIHQDGTTDQLINEVNHAKARLDWLERVESVAVTMWTLEGMEIASNLLISVVMPTRNRATLLPRAIESVVNQSYPNWELVIVDDGSTDATSDVLAGLNDPRIRTLRTDAGRCTVARNVALDHARGQVIAYLDDDNRFHPGWLKALAWTFATRPDVAVAYGARLVDDFERAHLRAAGGLPFMHFVHWDRAAAEVNNRADMNVMAHRPSEVRFDERVDFYGDWDLLLKLTDHDTPFELPAVAAYYSTTSPNRLSDAITDYEDLRQASMIRDAVGERLGRAVAR